MRDDGDKLLMVWYGREGGGNSLGTRGTKMGMAVRKSISLEIFGMCKSRRSFHLLRVKKKVMYEQRHKVLKTHTEDF